MKSAVVTVAVVLAAALAARGEEPAKTGGANAPDPSPPVKLAIPTEEIRLDTFSVRVPAGAYTAPKGGAANYTVPGPVVSFKGADGVWRGHGYLETYPRLEKFQAEAGGAAGGGARPQDATRVLTYTFEGGKTYTATLRLKNGAVLIDEESTLGPRNVWVFDCYYGGDDGVKNAWTPTAGFAVDAKAEKHAFVYLPCFYDKPEVTINPSAAAAANAGRPPAGPAPDPRGVAVLSSEAGSKDVAGFFARDVAAWKNGDAMGVQLWQRRQLPGDPASRHFIGPDTKSDSTPNPRTAGLMGKSLYEGHVTIELNLGAGSRKIAFAAAAKGEKKKRYGGGVQKCDEGERGTVKAECRAAEHGRTGASRSGLWPCEWRRVRRAW